MFHPLKLSKLAKQLDDGQYAYRWYTEEFAPVNYDAEPGGGDVAPVDVEDPEEQQAPDAPPSIEPEHPEHDLPLDEPVSIERGSRNRNIGSLTTSEVRA